eukprot:scaffold8187_cov18-Tisochrysis_lutea.AAC.2
MWVTVTAAGLVAAAVGAAEAQTAAAAVGGKSLVTGTSLYGSSQAEVAPTKAPVDPLATSSLTDEEGSQGKKKGQEEGEGV